MRALSCYKDIQIPCSGLLDTRSLGGQIGLQNFRMILNMAMTDQGKRCRLGGWKKLFSDSVYGFLNNDLHDQLLCQAWYYQTFTQQVTTGGFSGQYSYQYVNPAYQYTFADTSFGGTFCGYYPSYPQYSTFAGTSGCYIYSPFVGYPYQLIGGSSGSMSWFESAWGTQTGSNIHYSPNLQGDANTYLNNLEAVNGPSAAITDARWVITNVLVANTTTTPITQGQFSGTHGLVNWRYSIFYEAEFGLWATDWEFTSASGAPVYSPCSTGPPSYYAGSYFSLYCNTTSIVDFPQYQYGNGTPIYNPVSTYDYTYCGNYQFVRDGCREPITLIAEFDSSETSRKLIAGTQSRLYQLNERTGNWRIIADGLGGRPEADIGPCTAKLECDCGPRRFTSAVLGDYMIFTNNFDYPLIFQFDAQPSGCDYQSAVPIQSLVDLGIERAKVIYSWKGFVFLGNVTDSGTNYSNRLLWCDYNNPLQWAPSDLTQARFQDLDSSEKILAITSIGDFLFILTDTGIWQVVVVGGDEILRFRQIYSGQAGTIKFVNTLVNTGDAMVYLGEDGIYSYTLYDSAPQRLEWIHKASGVIYNGLSDDYIASFPYLTPFGPIQKSQCDQAVGGFDVIGDTIWFSWPTDGHTCPNMSLIINLRYQAASLVDHGFTAFCNYRSDPRPLIRDFLHDQKICQWSQFSDTFIKEGPPYPVTDAPFDDPPIYIWNATEDPNKPIDPNSWCARLGDTRMQDLCELCDIGPVFVMASALDKTLKQYTPLQDYRERFSPSGVCLNGIFTTAIDGAVYCADGYSSMMQSDMNTMGLLEEKQINQVLIDFEAEAQTTPNKLVCQVAISAQPRCTVWRNLGSKDMKCLDEGSESANTRPALPIKYPAFWRGAYIGYRFYVDSSNGSNNVTGGASCFNRVSLSVRQIQGTTHPS